MLPTCNLQSWNLCIFAAPKCDDGQKKNKIANVYAYSLESKIKVQVKKLKIDYETKSWK